MTDTSAFDALNLMTIPLDEYACVFEDKFILASNFDEEGRLRDLTNDPGLDLFLTAPYPFKIQIPIILLCLDGRMHVKLNLNEYDLHRNSLLFVPPGSIGQCLDISADCRIVFIALSNDYIIAEENLKGALIVRKFLARQTSLDLTDAQTAEILSICRAVQDKLRQPDFRFKYDILKGYLSRRVAAALHHGAQHRFLCRTVVPDAQIPLAGGTRRQRAPCRRVDSRLCNSGSQSLAEKRTIYDPTGIRHAEFRQSVFFRSLFQEGRRLFADSLQGDVSLRISAGRR